MCIQCNPGFIPCWCEPPERPCGLDPCPTREHWLEVEDSE